MMNILGLMPADAVGEMDDVNSYTLFANSCDFDAISAQMEKLKQIVTLIVRLKS